MALLWALLWLAHLKLALLSDLDYCEVDENSSMQSASTLLESLQCYNDYHSHIHCQWKKHGNMTQQLWFKSKDGSQLCVPSDAAKTDEHATLDCRYDTVAFGISTSHTVFFHNNITMSLCFSTRSKSVNLLQLLRARPPADLSLHEAGDGGRRLEWSSPYPPSSFLSENLTYQLGYRRQHEENWIVQNVTNTSLKLGKELFLPGYKYEARVRVRAKLGQWSDWAPVVTWQTEYDFMQIPTLDCVLEGDQEVKCSWEVSRELAQLITYQLACQHKMSGLSEQCCDNPTAQVDLHRHVVQFSCLLTVTDAENLGLNLQPKHNTKTFKSYQHIRPQPPQKVKVKGKDSDWIVEWSKPASKLRLFYQVCHYMTQNQGLCELQNISEGVTFMKIQGSSLASLEEYQVKVRSLVVPGEGFRYEGIPSEWTDPVKWTSNQATWSLSAQIYVLISGLVSFLSLTLYCTFPACQRKVLLWMETVPSPGKSKILSEMKSASCPTLPHNEKALICKVQDHDSLKTCSSVALLWPLKDAEKKCVEQDEECWGCNKLTPMEKTSCTCVNFSGPYIFCQPSKQTTKPSEDPSDGKEKETQSDVSTPLLLVPFNDTNYVCLPCSRYMQDFPSTCNHNANPQWYSGTKHDQHVENSQLQSIQLLKNPSTCKPTVQDQCPDYISESFSSWPQRNDIEASGYCHLPTVVMASSNSLHQSH